MKKYLKKIKTKRIIKNPKYKKIKLKEQLKTIWLKTIPRQKKLILIHKQPK